MKLVYATLNIISLLMLMSVMAHADDDQPEIQVPSKEDREISCETHCAYAEMGNEHALRVINLIPCDCGFNYPKEKVCQM